VIARAKPAARVPPAWIASEAVQKWMRQPVVTIDPATPVADAARLMRERGVRHLPVVDPDGRVVGIVTDRDLRQVLFDVALGGAEDETASAALRARDVMTWGVVTVTPATELREAVAIMRERRLGALPVLDPAGHVIGILTERDLLGALQALLRERVVRPRPATTASPEVYDPGIAPVDAGDPWRSIVELD
jgi:acetoin utilization protein AcuB